jgi:uncharacterized protein (TIGR04255 family)
MTNSRPNYERPPVVETVLGVQFDRLAGVSNSHLGVFWKSLDQQEWPSVEDVPPLSNQFERFVDAARWGAAIQLQLTDDPATRCRIKNRNGDRMIQLQNTRVHLNWLGEQGGEYPHHETMLAEFEKTFRAFSLFVASENVGQLRPNQWEVTYVNHIPKGTVWQTPNDWHFFQLLGSKTSASMVRAESFHGEWHLLIPEQRGRLHIQWQHAKKSPTDVNADDFIRLVFTARGPLEQSEDSFAAVVAGLNLGRDVIVTSFRDFASKEANDYWGLKNGC